jgi:hypothetical protein
MREYEAYSGIFFDREDIKKGNKSKNERVIV